MADTDWGVVANETDVNKSWKKFYIILNGAFKLCIPVCKRRPRSYNSQSDETAKLRQDYYIKNTHTMNFSHTYVIKKVNTNTDPFHIENGILYNKCRIRIGRSILPLKTPKKSRK